MNKQNRNNSSYSAGNFCQIQNSVLFEIINKPSFDSSSVHISEANLTGTNLLKSFNIDNNEVQELNPAQLNSSSSNAKFNFADPDNPAEMNADNKTGIFEEINFKPRKNLENKNVSSGNKSELKLNGLKATHYSFYETNSSEYNVLKRIKKHLKNLIFDNKNNYYNASHENHIGKKII